MAKQRRRHILVLAQTPSEAHTYARRANLPNFTYRAVSSAGQIRNVQVVDVHVLPNFEKRRDRHAIRAALRHGRDIRWYDVEMPPPAPRPDGLFPPGEQLDLLNLVDEQAADLAARDRAGELTDADVAELNAVSSALEADDQEDQGGEEAGAPEPSEDPAPAAPRRRRSRCRVCGTLHLADEPCPTAPEPPVDEPKPSVAPAGVWG